MNKSEGRAKELIFETFGNAPSKERLANFEKMWFEFISSGHDAYKPKEIMEEFIAYVQIRTRTKLIRPTIEEIQGGKNKSEE